MKSFRLRIILWTSAIAGVVMLGFGVAGNLAFERIKAKQVEDSLLLLVDRNTPPPSQSRFWERFGPETFAELQDRFGTDVLLVCYGRPADAEAGSGYSLVSWGKLAELYADDAELPSVSGEFDAFDERGRSLGYRLGRLLPDGPDRDRDREWHEVGGRAGSIIMSRVSSLDGSLWQIALRRHQGYNVLIGLNVELLRKDIALMRQAFAFFFPVALAAMALCIWIFVTRAIQPVRRLSETIEKVSAQSLGARLEGAGEYQEFASLIDHFNGMLERLERSFLQATRFSADAAHELKTPLAILQGQLEVALQEARDDSDQQRQFAGLLEETHRLKLITRKLLILARADAGTLEVQLESVEIHGLLTDLVDLAAYDEEELSVVLEAEGKGPFVAQCDETLTRQILNNLIGNACKYRSPLESTVRIVLQTVPSFVRIEIANDCLAIRSELRSRLFDRFIRGSAARNRSEDGMGLGLSLSLEFARAQGSHLELVEGTDECELKMRLDIPLG